MTQYIELKIVLYVNSVNTGICRVFRANYNCAIDINKSYVIQKGI